MFKQTMKNLKKFVEFINEEAYLSSGRYLLYHCSNNLKDIISSDKLLAREPTEDDDMGDSISFSRYINWSNEGGFYYRYVMDSDILKRYGYKSKPISEIMLRAKRGGKTDVNFTKSNIEHFKSGKRGTEHGTNLPKDWSLEYEFEERIYKNIENLGKYLVFIDFKNGDNIEYNYDILKEYLEKYPHIKLRLIGDKLNLVKEVDIKKYSPEYIKELS